MLYHLNTQSAIQVFTAFAAIFTMAVLWKARKQEEVKYLIQLEILVAVWAICYAFEFATGDLQLKIFWSKMSYFGIAFLPLLYFLFTMAFSKNIGWISNRMIVWLSAIPVLTLFLVLTNEAHHLVWKEITLDPLNNFILYKHGIWFWFFLAYTQLLIFAGLYNLVRSIFHFPNFYKIQIGTLLVASFIPVVGNSMYITGLNPIPGFDWTPVSFVLTGLIISLGIRSFRMFEIVPFAKNKLFETMDDSVIVLNSKQIIEDCNSATYKVFALLGETVVGESFEKVFGKYNNIIAGLKNGETEIQLKISNAGEYSYYQVKISSIYRKNNHVGNLLVVHDISSVKKAEDVMKKINDQLTIEIEKRGKLIEDLDDFAHTVAHDLRNSLGSIFSASEIMEDIIEKNDKKLLLEITDLIKYSANKSIKITHELLILATTEKQDVQRKKLHMKAIFSEAKKQLSELIKDSGAIIKEPADWPDAIGYSPWIEEVWTNYLSNAIKYGGSPPVVEVGADVLSDRRISFWITDNGPGISPANRERLFKDFVRLAPKRAKGYGLGLYIVKKIIEKLDGTVGIENTENGKGAKFYFILPADKTLEKGLLDAFYQSGHITVN